MTNATLISTPNAHADHWWPHMHKPYSCWRSSFLPLYMLSPPTLVAANMATLHCSWCTWSIWYCLTQPFPHAAASWPSATAWSSTTGAVSADTTQLHLWCLVAMFYLYNNVSKQHKNLSSKLLTPCILQCSKTKPWVLPLSHCRPCWHTLLQHMGQSSPWTLMPTITASLHCGHPRINQRLVEVHLWMLTDCCGQWQGYHWCHYNASHAHHLPKYWHFP